MKPFAAPPNERRGTVLTERLQRNATKRGRHCESPALAAAVRVRNSVADRGRARPPAPDLGEKVIAIEIHNLVPGSHEVSHELRLRVVSRVDLL